MLPHYPFTPAGAAAKMVDLYALSDNDLKIQADAIKADLRAWVNDNFTLNGQQQAYLTNLDEQSVNYIGDQCSLCFLNRLPVILMQEESSDDDDLPQLKFIHTENTVRTKSNDAGNFTAFGTFIIRIVYQNI